MRSEIQTLGPLCTVDLFPVPIQANVKDLSDRQAPHTPPAHPPFPSAGPSHISHPAEQAHTIFTFVPNEYPTKQPSVEFLPLPSHCIPAFLPPPPSGAGIVRDVDDFPIIERSKMTHALVGATFAQSAIVEYQGKKSIMFVFAVSSSRWLSLGLTNTLSLCTGSRSQSRGEFHPSISGF
jgi:hypothetical protein